MLFRIIVSCSFGQEKHIFNYKLGSIVNTIYLSVHYVLKNKINILKPIYTTEIKSPASLGTQF